MRRLDSENNAYKFNTTKDFSSIRTLKSSTIENIFDFAYKISFAGVGEHRDHRSDGIIRRKNGEIFINTFQWKLAEFGIYNEFFLKDIQIPLPDTKTYKLGKWDQYNFKVKDKRIAVKSTKFYGQILLLETGDWNNNGEYLPNRTTDNAFYDYFNKDFS